MHRFRIRAGLAALVVVLVVTGCKWTGINVPAVRSTAKHARDWLVTKQQPDGGFEIAGFAGFETPDAILAIAEDAQQQATWNQAQALAAVTAVKVGGRSPLDWADDFADGPINAGQAAKLLVLVAAPLGLPIKTFNPQNDATKRNLISTVDAGAQPNGSYGAFNATLYAALARWIVTGSVPANTLAYIRAGQQSSGGWNFANDPTGSDADIDTTSLVIQVLVAARVAVDDTDLRQAVAFLAHQQRPNGSFQSFGEDDPNSTALAVMAITAVGENAAFPCWRDRAVPALHGSAYSSPLAWLRGQAAPDGHIASHNDTEAPPVTTFATTQSIEALRRGWLPVAYQPALLCT